MMEAFFYEAFDEEADALRRVLPASLAAGFARATIQESGHARPPARLISIRTQSVLPPDWAPQLDGILSRSAGYDHLAAYAAGLPSPPALGYLPRYCARAVAEHALLLWTALLRKLPRQCAQFGRFDRDGITGAECLNKTLLVVGVGTIGIEIVRLGVGMGMDVLGVDIVRRHPSVHYVSLGAGLARADVIVCAMNLTGDNQGYFRYKTLAGVKPGAIFVNIARGEMSPPLDLLRLLDAGLLGGVGLDVHDHESELAVALRQEQQSSDETVRATLELGRRADVILTPHNAFNTREAVARKAGQTAMQVTHFLRHRTFLWTPPTPAQDARPPETNMV